MSFETNRRTGLPYLLAATALGMLVALGTPRAASAQCVGDCNGDGNVTVDEIVTMVNIALGSVDISSCTAGDADGGGTITVDEIITALNNALNGCPSVGMGSCGNGVTDGDEDCDDGGTCIGGDNAGMACSSEEQCNGNGICLGGIRVGTMCSTDDDCPQSSCVRCKPFGGDGCAANCTTEKKIPFELKPGIVDGLDLRAGTSGVVVYSSLLAGVPITLGLSGSLALIVGEERNGEIPVVVNQNDIDFPAIAVLSFACACVKGTTPLTCGGVGFLEDGVTLSPDCTDDEDLCERRGLPPCAPLHGPGNTASGTIGCNGLDGTDITALLDNQGDLSVTLGGMGGPGSALVFTSIDIAIALGSCTGSGSEYGPDGMFCTADDPPNDLSAAGTGPTTTGTACGQIDNDEGGVGPECITGSPLSCPAIGMSPGSVSDTCLTFALPVADVETVGDLVATLTLCAQ